jgi:hypothetical protein
MTTLYSFYAPDGTLSNRIYGGPVEQLELNTPPGYAPIPGRHDYRNKRVDVSAIPPEEENPPVGWFPPVIDYQPPQPEGDDDTDWEWDTQVKLWMEKPSLKWLKRVKFDEICAAATVASNADITVQGETFTADAVTRAELSAELALAQAEGASYSCSWQRADGTAITLTGAQVAALLKKISQRLAAIRAQVRTLRSAIEAATTKAAIDAIVWA